VQDMTYTPQRLVVPPGVSKSMAKSMACGTHFVYQYLGMRALRQRGPSHPLSVVGKQFHEWRAAYVTHLVATGQSRDWTFAERYVAGTEGLLEDTAWLIRNQDRGFEINPDTVYGAEVFLSCDSDLRPLDHEIGNPTPGKLSAHPDAFASATLDLLCIDGDHAVIIDPKSGFSTVGVTDDEPPINALVVFAHFPMVQTVEFRWDFVRNRVNRRARYDRKADLHWMVERVAALNRRKLALVEAYYRREPLDLDWLAGLCPYCLLRCPLRDQIQNLAVGPVQTEDDARRVASVIYLAEQFLSQARGPLKAWIDGRGPLRLSGEWTYRPHVTTGTSYTLPDALAALGMRAVPIGIDMYARDAETGMELPIPRFTSSPKFDVPLASLTVSASKLNSYARTKKSKRLVSRAGLAAELEAVGKTYPKTSLRFTRETATDLMADLEASLEERQRLLEAPAEDDEE